MHVNNLKGFRLKGAGLNRAQEPSQMHLRHLARPSWSSDMSLVRFGSSREGPSHVPVQAENFARRPCFSPPAAVKSLPLQLKATRNHILRGESYPFVFHSSPGHSNLLRAS